MDDLYGGYGGYWGKSFGGWYDSAALRRLTAVISSKTGIQVVEGRAWGYDSKNKILYYSPSDFYSLNIDGIFGIILHEIGHALFTPPVSLDKISDLFEKYPNQMGWLLNSLENMRIERLLKGTYPHSPKFLKEGFDGVRWMRKSYDEEKEDEKWKSQLDSDYWGWGTKPKARKKEKKEETPLSWWLAEEIDYSRWGQTCFERNPMPKKLKEVWVKVKPLTLEYEKQDDFGKASKILDQIGKLAQPLFIDENTEAFKVMLKVLADLVGKLAGLVGGDKEPSEITAKAITECFNLAGGNEKDEEGIDFDPYSKIRAKVLPKAYSLVSRLKPLLIERRKIREDFGYRSGKLDVPRLWKHRTGSTRLFRKIEMREGFTLPPFVLLADFSASMNKPSVRIAMSAMSLFSIALNSLKAQHSLIAFSNEAKEIKSFTEGEMSESTLRKSKEVKQRGTHDFEAMKLANELLKKKGAKTDTKPVIISFTDGESNDKEALEREIRQLEKDYNALIIGISIGTIPRKIYPREISIESIEELPSTLGALLKQELTKLLRSR